MKIDPNEPAYPQPVAASVDGGIYTTMDVNGGMLGGLTIRADISSRIMAGLVSCAEMRSRYSQENIANDAVSLADALIAELNKEPQS